MRGEKPIKYSLVGLFVLFLIFFVWMLWSGGLNLRNPFSENSERDKLKSFFISGIVQEYADGSLTVREINQDKLASFSTEKNRQEKLSPEIISFKMTEKTKHEKVPTEYLKAGQSVQVEAIKIADNPVAYEAVAIENMSPEEWISFISDASFGAILQSIEDTTITFSVKEEEREKVGTILPLNEEGVATLNLPEEAIFMRTSWEDLFPGQKVVLGVVRIPESSEYEVRIVFNPMSKKELEETVVAQ